VVVNDVGGEAWLASRQSVVAAGLSALACLPLLEDGRAFGAIYVDRVRPGPAITELDLELLQAFVEGAAVWIAAQRAAAMLDGGGAGREHPATRWDGIVAAHADTP
jgi:GAF domain-containing protein